MNRVPNIKPSTNQDFHYQLTLNLQGRLDEIDLKVLTLKVMEEAIRLLGFTIAGTSITVTELVEADRSVQTDAPAAPEAPKV